MELRIGHLYADLMSIYGDRGNVLCLAQRARWRGIACTVTPLGLGDALVPEAHDLLFMGGGQDREQRLVAEDFQAAKGQPLREAAEAGVAILAICGGYQLMGHYYRDADGTELPGVGLFDAYTVPGKGPRLIGNVIVQCVIPGLEDRTLVGFENHGGRTHLQGETQPLGKVVVGGGNNGEDGFEGAVCRNAFGTYLHGSCLPKNPWLADLLIRRGLERRYGAVELAPLDDTLEEEANAAAVNRARETR